MFQCRWCLNVPLVFKPGARPIKARDTSASSRFSRLVPRRFGSGPSKWYICRNLVFKTSGFSSLFTFILLCAATMTSRQTGSLGATVTTRYLCASCDSEINEIWQIYTSEISRTNNDYNISTMEKFHCSIVTGIVPLLRGDDSRGLDGPPGPTSRLLWSLLLAKDLQSFLLFLTLLWPF